MVWFSKIVHMFIVTTDVCKRIHISSQSSRLYVYIVLYICLCIGTLSLLEWFLNNTQSEVGEFWNDPGEFGPLDNKSQYYTQSPMQLSCDGKEWITAHDARDPFIEAFHMCASHTMTQSSIERSVWRLARRKNERKGWYSDAGGNNGVIFAWAREGENMKCGRLDTSQ